MRVVVHGRGRVVEAARRVVGNNRRADVESGHPMPSPCLPAMLVDATKSRIVWLRGHHRQREPEQLGSRQENLALVYFRRPFAISTTSSRRCGRGGTLHRSAFVLQIQMFLDLLNPPWQIKLFQSKLFMGLTGRPNIAPCDETEK